MHTVTKKGSKTRRQYPGSGEDPLPVNQGEQLLQSVSYLKVTDVQEVMGVWSKTVLTEEELILCSRTGRTTSKCNGEPLPPLNAVKLEVRASRKERKHGF